MATFSGFSDSADDKRKATKIVVAAIDFGTTFSGYAFATAPDYEEDPPKVHMYNQWVAGGSLISHKAPTAILLNPDQSFRAFGYEAEDEYGQFAADEEHDKYYYFRRFKMDLYKTHLKRDTVLTDENGKTMNAIKVFSLSMKFLKDHFLQHVKLRVDAIVESDVHWVITVPAIWSDSSKQFMREAAEQAGIKGENLTIALEPEAASLYCMHLPVDMMAVSGSDMKQSICPFKPSTKYMVVDLGGGTVDITVHQVVTKNKIKELNYATGGAWGGTKVDAAYEDFIISIFGKDVYEKFKKEHVEEAVDILREFETKKRSAKNEASAKQTIKVPYPLFEMYNKLKKTPLEDVTNKNRRLAGKVIATPGKLRIDTEIIKDWFKDSCDNTIQHMKSLFKEPDSVGTNTILLVGGFSECGILQEAIKQSFKDKRVIIPADAGIAVLKGAVLFGHDPLTITSRKAKCSYGVRVFRDYDSTLHPLDKREVVGGKEKCKDVFAKHVEKGQALVVGQAQMSQRYTPLEPDQISLIFDIFTSTELDPTFVTDASCTNIGQLEVNIPGYGKGRAVNVQMKFGGTELIVEATEEATNNVTSAKFNFLI